MPDVEIYLKIIMAFFIAYLAVAGIAIHVLEKMYIVLRAIADRQEKQVKAEPSEKEV